MRLGLSIALIFYPTPPIYCSCRHTCVLLHQGCNLSPQTEPIIVIAIFPTKQLQSQWKSGWRLCPSHWSSMLSVFLEIRFSSVVLPTSITRLWVKALWFRQNVGRRKWRRVSHVTLDGHMCSHRRWLFPLQPFSLRCSLIWPTDCSLPKSDARILSHCHPTEPRCTLVNMSKVGRAPWTHMSHFLDMSHCALNSLPLWSFMAFLWPGHFSATIRSVTDSCSNSSRGSGRSQRSPRHYWSRERCTLPEQRPECSRLLGCWIITTMHCAAAEKALEWGWVQCSSLEHRPTPDCRLRRARQLNHDAATLAATRMRYTGLHCEST